MICIHLLIKGRVQGVYFRSSAKSVADELGIYGWIRNTADGHVELLACGKDPQLSRFIEWCRTGPARARVEDLIQKSSDLVHHENFEILR